MASKKGIPCENDTNLINLLKDEEIEVAVKINFVIVTSDLKPVSICIIDNLKKKLFMY